MLMDGRHFLLDQDGPEAIGYKALAVNLSDIAAMAGVPVAAFVAVALPPGRAVEVAKGLLDGMLPLAQRYAVALAGGDTNAWEGPLVVAITMLGQTTPAGPVLRSGARVGDAIFVTGPLGGSLLGRHVRPRPRIEEAQALQRTGSLRAMIDISDGLTADLNHILEESGGLGATIAADAVPIHADAFTLAARDGLAPLEHALHDGEDFELCAVIDRDAAERLAANPPPGVTLSRIGVIEAQPGLRLRTADGRVIPIEPRGFDHLAPP
jgi:thiamine-monophosphate kinase